MLYSLYINLEKSLKKNYTYGYGTSAFTILGILFIISSLCVPLLLDRGPSVSIIYAVGIFLGVLSLVNGNNWLIKKRGEMLQELRDNNKTLLNTADTIDNADIILVKTQTILEVLQKIKFNHYFIDWFYSDRIDEEQCQIFQKEITFLCELLKDLRSDLQIRLAEQQKLLEGAKSEVEKISKTPLPPFSGGPGDSLTQFSELQSARLDRQIEQFEELRRVLVKV